MSLPKRFYQKVRQINIAKYVRGVAIRLERRSSRGLLKTPGFYFTLIAFVLFSGVYSSSGNLANVSGLSDSRVVFFNSFFDGAIPAVSLFSSSADNVAIESPDLKIIQNNTLAGISTPTLVSGKVLGDVIGSSPQSKNTKEVIEYTVQPGDTLASIAKEYGITTNTLLLANNLSSSSVIKVGQTLAILPVDGVLHAVESGDTVSVIAQTYKAKQSDIIAFNNLAHEDDIFIGDILIVPGGTMPKKAQAVNQVPLADNYFIFPVEGKITQGLHYYNAVDIANKCGTPVYVAASGVVQRAVFNNAWNLGMGNYITILHPNGTVTYYGHLSSVFVKPGDQITRSERIGLVGNTGNVVGATGCHLHFQVVGAANPLAKYAVGANISYK